MAINRRQFIKLASAAGAISGLSLAGCAANAKSDGARVVVIGGGSGGATAAKYIRVLDPSVQVTLIEPKQAYATCFMSNWVIGGLKDQQWITHSYAGWADKYGIDVIHEMAVQVDPEAKKVKTSGGKTVSYDRLVVAPGISFRYDAIEGYDEAAAQKCPHAWQAGPQTALLRDQLEAMPNGGLYVLVAPPNPFRCPPGPYERVSLVANYFKSHKPKSKILILDSKEGFSKQGLFTAGWKQHYGYDTDDSLIEWRPKSADGLVRRVDAGKRIAYTEFDDIEADVLNVVPAQKAGLIAFSADLTDDSGWCPVDQITWESTRHPGIHVIGDAAIASPLPKSGYAANSQAKVCAAAVVAMLKGDEPPTPSWVNTCYSLVAPTHGISVAMVYDSKDGSVSKVEGSGGLTPMGGNYAMEAIYAESWYKNIISDIYG